MLNKGINIFILRKVSTWENAFFFQTCGTLWGKQALQQEPKFCEIPYPSRQVINQTLRNAEGFNKLTASCLTFAQIWQTNYLSNYKVRMWTSMSSSLKVERVAGQVEWVNEARKYSTYSPQRVQDKISLCTGLPVKCSCAFISAT